MTYAWKVRTGDKVCVIAGKNKGQIGEIVRVIRSTERVVVKGVNLVKRHTKPTAFAPGGIVEKEAPIHVSNVMHCDPETGKPTRIGMRFLADGTKERYGKKSGKAISSN